MSGELDRQIIGYASEQIEHRGREAQFVKQTLQRVAELPDEFGGTYDKAVVDEYGKLLDEAKDYQDSECRDALEKLQLWISQSYREWKPIDLTNDKQRGLFAKALKGLTSVGEVGAGSMSLAMTPDTMGPILRQFHGYDVTTEMRQLMGLEGMGADVKYSSDDLLTLLGNIVFVNPNEMGTLLTLMERDFGSFNGRFTDEMLVLTDVFANMREGGTYTTLMAFSDISKLGVEEYGKHITNINPDEMFFLAHLPFRLKEKVSGIERTLTIAQITDFLASPRGRNYFRMTPHMQAKYGISEYIKWFEELYPRAEQGLALMSNYQVADVKRGYGLKPAEVLDEGRLGLEGLDDTYVRMGENPTWMRAMKIARGIVNLFDKRGKYYRHDAVFRLGPDFQKSSDVYPFYLNAYRLFDGFQRNTFPRFRSLAEYLGYNSNPWGFFSKNKLFDLKLVGPNKTVHVDLVDAYHPRKLEICDATGAVDANRTRMWQGMIERGMEEPNFPDPEVRMNAQYDILTMFYALEPDPASTDYEEAVATLIARGAGRWVDELNQPHDTTPLTREQQIALAWDLRFKLKQKAIKFGNKFDQGLDTLQQYRTFYPLPPEMVAMKLANVEDSLRTRVAGYGFKGKVVFLGGPESLSDNDYKGVDGLALIAGNMGSGLWKVPKYGEADKNKMQKHATYEANMVEVYQLITKMAVGSTQGKMGEAEEEMARSLVHGHQDLNERTVEAIDKLVNTLRGIQANPQLRAASWKEFSEAYVQAIQKVGFMTDMRGVWWLYRYGCVMAKYMSGMATSLPYLSGTRPFRQPIKDNPSAKVYNPVTPGQALATYANLYKNPDGTSRLDGVSEEALAILDCYKDGDDIVGVAKAGGLYPVAMVMGTGGAEVSPKRVNVADQFGHMRQLPKGQEASEHIIKEALLEVIRDLKIDAEGDEKYYTSGLSGKH